MSDVQAFLNFLQGWGIMIAAVVVVAVTVGGAVYVVRYWKS